MANVTCRCKNCGRLFGEKSNVGGLSAGKAAIGTILAGSAGAIVGAAMGKTVKNNCCPYCGSHMITRCK